MHYESVTFKSRDANLSESELSNLRQEGWIPAVISRGGEPPITIFVPEKEFAHAVHKTGVGGILRLVDEADKAHLAQLKELQWHPTSRKLLHASFVEVRAREEVVANVPIIFTGEPEAVATRVGQLVRPEETIAVRAKVTDLPDAVGLDISELEIGDTVTAGDILLPDGCEAAHPETVICTLIPATVVEEPTEVAEEEEAAEPELVGASTEESESEEG